MGRLERGVAGQGFGVPALVAEIVVHDGIGNPSAPASAEVGTRAVEHIKRVDDGLRVSQHVGVGALGLEVLNDGLEQLWIDRHGQSLFEHEG